MWTRLNFFLLLSLVSLTSCDQILKLVAKPRRNHSISDQLQISSQLKPEIVAAFEAISRATLEHNRVLIQSIERDQPANELAFSAGLDLLNRSANKQTGLAKQIINALIVTGAYEKDLFIPFDTIRRQIKGMPGWTKDQALQLRGYVQILDEEIATYDIALTYLERGEEPLLRRNFSKQAVPDEVVKEFFRLRQLMGREASECNKGMFREQRSALQCYREALTSTTPATATQHTAQATQHEQQAKQFEGRMIAAIRKQLSAAGML